MVEGPRQRMSAFEKRVGATNDLTAIGTVVNTASRAQSAAAPEEILVTQAVYDSLRMELQGSSVQGYRLKGFQAPIRLYAA